MTDWTDLAPGDDALLDDRIRGFPTGHAALRASEVGGRGWRPQDGRMALPLLSLDLDGFAANTDLFLRHVAGAGALIAPHVKTPMSATLARRLAEAGAWGMTVANPQQASVMLAAGIERLILANEVGGLAGARRLAALMRRYPGVELHVWVDSQVGAEALVQAWSEAAGEGAAMPRLGLMVELGTDRAGLRDAGAAMALADRVVALSNDLVTASGIATYEGASMTADHDESLARIDALLARVAEVHAHLCARTGRGEELILTAGGSLWFDRVLALLGPAARATGSRLVLRSGAVFFHDEGLYERGIAHLRARGGHPEGELRPTLRLWAQVQSRPADDLAIIGFGMRDAAIDQGLPMPVQLWRDGRPVPGAEAMTVRRLNDQHAFVALAAGAEVAIGDVVEFGLSHPCTNLDRHAVIWGLGPDHEVRAALPTSFG